MHAKKFLGKKIYVTSVVSLSPTKTSPSVSADQTSPAKPPPTSPTKTPLITPALNSQQGVSVLPKLNPALSRSKSINSLADFHFQDIQVDPAGMKGNVASLGTIFSPKDKRKALSSPESNELSKKEKKVLKTELKNKSKNEKKAAAQLVSPTKIL